MDVDLGVILSPTHNLSKIYSYLELKSERSPEVSRSLPYVATLVTKQIISTPTATHRRPGLRNRRGNSVGCMSLVSALLTDIMSSRHSYRCPNDISPALLCPICHEGVRSLSPNFLYFLSDEGCCAMVRISSQTKKLIYLVVKGIVFAKSAYWHG